MPPEDAFSGVELSRLQELGVTKEAGIIKRGPAALSPKSARMILTAHALGLEIVDEDGNLKKSADIRKVFEPVEKSLKERLGLEVDDNGRWVFEIEGGEKVEIPTKDSLDVVKKAYEGLEAGADQEVIKGDIRESLEIKAEKVETDDAIKVLREGTPLHLLVDSMSKTISDPEVPEERRNALENQLASNAFVNAALKLRKKEKLGFLGGIRRWFGKTFTGIAEVSEEQYNQTWTKIAEACRKVGVEAYGNGDYRRSRECYTLLKKVPPEILKSMAKTDGELPPGMFIDGLYKDKNWGGIVENVVENEVVKPAVNAIDSGSPDYTRVWSQVGEAYEKEGYPARASEAYGKAEKAEKVEALKPKLDRANLEKRFKSAREELAGLEVVEEEPETVETQKTLFNSVIGLGSEAFDSGFKDLAKKYYGEAVEYAREPGDLHTLGGELLDSGFRDLAHECFERFILSAETPADLARLGREMMDAGFEDDLAHGCYARFMDSPPEQRRIHSVEDLPLLVYGSYSDARNPIAKEGFREDAWKMLSHEWMIKNASKLDPNNKYYSLVWDKITEGLLHNGNWSDLTELRDWGTVVEILSDKKKFKTLTSKEVGGRFKQMNVSDMNDEDKTRYASIRSKVGDAFENVYDSQNALTEYAWAYHANPDDYNTKRALENVGEKLGLGNTLEEIMGKITLVESQKPTL